MPGTRTFQLRRTTSELSILRHSSAPIAMVLLAVAITSSSVHAEPRPVLHIDVAKTTARVSPLHAGLMTEEINHSYDGGLYAELIRDRALGGGVLPKAG